MVAIPLGAELNLGIQLVSLALILVGLRYAIKTHSAFAQGKEEGAKLEGMHKNLMTSAVILSGIGTIIWMVPNFILGWFYSPGGLILEPEATRATSRSRERPLRTGI